jgi:hypothetical protein
MARPLVMQHFLRGPVRCSDQADKPFYQYTESAVNRYV